MTEASDEVPLLIIQPDKMFSSWSSTIKLCIAIVISFTLYGFLHIYIRRFLLKNKRLELIGGMIMETEKMMQNMYIVDQTLALDMEEMNEFCLDDYWQGDC